MKHLLAIADLSRADIERLLDGAEELSRKADSSLTGATVVNLFLEASTRTRVSFEIAAKRLGADVVNMVAAGSSVVKGESLLDTGKTLDAMGSDVVVIRHSFAGAAAYLSKRLRASIVNAGDGQHEHPTQALLDAYTIRKHKKTLEKKTIAIVGDIRHSRVARSGIRCFSKLGATVRVSGPPTLIPPGIEALGCKVVAKVDEAVAGADVIMALRIQNERMTESFVPSAKEYAVSWGIDERRVALAKPDAIVLHPGPLNRGVEITGAVADSAKSVIEEQVGTGVLVRMSVLREVIASRNVKKKASAR